MTKAMLSVASFINVNHLVSKFARLRCTSDWSIIFGFGMKDKRFDKILACAADKLYLERLIVVLACFCLRLNSFLLLQLWFLLLIANQIPLGGLVVLGIVPLWWGAGSWLIPASSRVPWLRVPPASATITSSSSASATVLILTMT